MINPAIRFALAAALTLTASQADAKTIVVSRTCVGTTASIEATGEAFAPTEPTYDCKGRGGRSILRARGDTIVVPADGSCPAGQLQYEFDATFPNGGVETFKNGSQIFTTDDVLVGCIDLTVLPFEAHWSGTGTITGGTGKYAGAQGSIEFSGTTLIQTGENGVRPQSIELTGTLTLP